MQHPAALAGVSGGSVNINGNVNIQGNSASALSAQVGGSVSVQTSCTVTLVGTPASDGASTTPPDLPRRTMFFRAAGREHKPK